ncbi:MAG: hypothetical protein L3J44_08175 [Campylobacteraceae bacterium]|nr:hypothetical protein [Campylobacteraceae bacterium]
MKKILVIFLLTFNISFAGINGKEIKFEAKLIDKIVEILFKKEKLYVYVYGNEAEKVIVYSKVLVKTKNIEKADFILASTKINSNTKFKNSKKPIIGMKYFLLKDENVIGAIFWHKGRPNIVFIRKRFFVLKIECMLLKRMRQNFFVFRKFFFKLHAGIGGGG